MAKMNLVANNMELFILRAMNHRQSPLALRIAFGTNSRRDDAITSYSSRGPTRSYWTDRYGVNHYDNLIKPDVVAPGNKLIFAEAANNYLVATHPELETGMAPGKTNQKMMYLSGTSVSAPLVVWRCSTAASGKPEIDAQHGEDDSHVHGATTP